MGAFYIACNSDFARGIILGALQVQHLLYGLSAINGVLSWTMRQSNKSPKTISRLIDRLEVAREELLKIQRSLEEHEAVNESLTGAGKIVSRRQLILPMTSEPRAQNIQSLAEELEHLKSEQDKAMSLAVYVGMSKEELGLFDQRRKRIYELYDALLVLKGQATHSH